MKLTNRRLINFAGLMASSAIRHWMSTLEYKAAFYDPSVDPVHPENSGQKIYVFWHEYVLFPLYLRGHCNLTMLLSQHRDAEVLARTAQHMGFECVRGSTFRGSSGALRELVRKSKTMNLTMTPDGPRGPRRTLAQGPVYLASKLGLPLVLMGYPYHGAWRMNSWDRFAVPRPFSRARAVIGPPLDIPANLDREGLERYRLHAEQMMRQLSLEAEAWAESGTRKVCEVPLSREPAALKHDASMAESMPFARRETSVAVMKRAG